MRIGFLSPAPIEGSGGLRTIFSYARALKRKGKDVDVIIVDSVESRNVKQLVRDFYGIEGVGLRYWPCSIHDFDILIATRWDTAKIVRDSGVKGQLYLVQDFEAWFNPMGDGFIGGENSYLYNIKTLTLGAWLSRKLSYEFGNKPSHIEFGVDNAVYYSTKLPSDRQDAICAIVQPEKPRRCTHLVIEALGIVKANFPNTRIFMYGGERIDLWYEADQLGIVSPEKLAELYNQCRAGLCISSSNPSRVPFEMMACGLPVVDLYRSNNLFDLPFEGCLLAHQTPESVSEALMMLLKNSELAGDLSNGGLASMDGRTFEKECNDFAEAVLSLYGSDGVSVSVPTMKYTREPVIAPVYERDDVLKHCSFHASLH